MSTVCHATPIVGNVIAIPENATTRSSGVALLLATIGHVARAVEIWTLAKSHPFVANSKWFEDAAGRELAALAATLPPEVAAAARERGQRLELWPTAETLLAELEVTNTAEK